MNLSESYKKRMQELAGIVVLSEVTDAERNAAFAGSNQRIPYNKDLMIQAIKQGREVGILFQSDNEKYKMPTSKYRIIYPVAIGLSKAGNQVIRAFHKFGQSESEARRTNKRSAEAENTWRLLKASNIKSMWFTGTLFFGPLESYNRSDKGMVNVEVAADFNKIKKYQEGLISQIKGDEARKKKESEIVRLPEIPEKGGKKSPSKLKGR
jgi:hypothetical protein